MNTPSRIIVTRPHGQADRLQAALSQLGLESVHMPLLEIQPLEPLPQDARQCLLDLDLYEHVIFVSANAALCGLEAIDGFWPQYPVGQQIWAVGETTGQLLRSAGMSAHWPETEMNSEGLLALPGLDAVAGTRVLIVRGEGGREKIAQVLGERGAKVDALRCYRRKGKSYQVEELYDLFPVASPALILVSSGEGLEHLSRLLHALENSNLADHTLVVPSARVEALARDLGWRDLLLAKNASDAAMIEAVSQRCR